MSVPVIAVDGPGGAGKGTLCRALARHLNWHYLDSGALYRLLALKAQRESVAPGQAAELVPGMDIRFNLDDNAVYLDGAMVGDALRHENVAATASEVAALPAVRAALLDKQRAFAAAPGLVADGRDMGTVVFPQARVKIFLDASAEERARRREQELRAAGRSAIFERIFEEICARDDRDRNRAIAPLRPADDAHRLDSTAQSPQDVLNTALGWVAEAGLLPSRSQT